MDRVEPQRREDYPHLQWITTRWSDNDIYGHVNNVVYFAYFDTVVNQCCFALYSGRDFAVGSGEWSDGFTGLRPTPDWDEQGVRTTP